MAVGNCDRVILYLKVVQVLFSEDSAIEEERRYRSDVEILLEILEHIVSASDKGIKKTHLMYKTNLNSKMLAKYLDMLIKAECIEEIRIGKLKVIRLRPAGKRVYASLKVLAGILFPKKEPPEVEFVKKELERLGTLGWNVKLDRIVIGKSGVDHEPDVILSKDAERYLVYLSYGKGDIESRVLLLDAITAVLDTGSKGIVISDREGDLARAVPEELKGRFHVIAVKPLESLLDRVVAALGEKTGREKST